VIQDIIIAMLWSISPFGEAKVGIPYAMFNQVNIYVALVLCFAANVLVYPLMLIFLDSANRYFLKWRFYKKSALFVARRAKGGAKKNVMKYGFWGLLIFVMLPIPGTGVYAGTIATYLFMLDRKQAFIANTAGIFLSCVMVWGMTLATMKGLE